MASPIDVVLKQWVPAVLRDPRALLAPDDEDHVVPSSVPVQPARLHCRLWRKSPERLR